MAAGLSQLVAMPSVSANACGNNYAPDMGVVQAVGPWHGDQYHATFEFLLTPVQIVNLHCRADYLEIDFKLYGFTLHAGPAGWQDYRLQTNLPGGLRDTSLFDGSSRIASVTGIRTADLVMNRPYYATVLWTAQSAYDPRVEVSFVPSRWANFTIDPLEVILCELGNYWPAFCVFGLENLAYELTKDRFSQYSGKLPFYTSGPPYIFGAWTGQPASGGSEPWQDDPLPVVTHPSAAIAPIPDPITPTAISRSDHTMDVFYKSTEGNLVARGWDVDFGWNYQWWPDQLAGNPVAVARKPGAMDVFYRRADGSLWNRGWDTGNGGWSDPVKLIGSCVVGDPAVISRAPGEMDVFWSL